MNIRKLSDKTCRW